MLASMLELLREATHQARLERQRRHRIGPGRRTLDVDHRLANRGKNYSERGKLECAKRLRRMT